MPSSDDSSSSEEISFDSAPATTKREPKSKTTDPLNDCLRTQEISPICSRLQWPWEEASERTRRYYVRKAGQRLSTLLQDIAPSDSGSLFKAVYSSGVIQRTLQRRGSHKQFSRRNHDERTRRVLPCSRQLGDASANPVHYG